MIGFMIGRVIKYSRIKNRGEEASAQESGTESGKGLGTVTRKRLRNGTRDRTEAPAQNGRLRRFTKV